MLQQEFEQQLITNNFSKNFDNPLTYLSPLFWRTFVNERKLFQIKIQLFNSNVIIYIRDTNNSDVDEDIKGQSYNYVEGYDVLKKLELIKENNIPLDYQMD